MKKKKWIFVFGSILVALLFSGAVFAVDIADIPPTEYTTSRYGAGWECEPWSNRWIPIGSTYCESTPHGLLCIAYSPAGVVEFQEYYMMRDCINTITGETVTDYRTTEMSTGCCGHCLFDDSY